MGVHAQVGPTSCSLVNFNFSIFLKLFPFEPVIKSTDNRLIAKSLP